MRPVLADVQREWIGPCGVEIGRQLDQVLLAVRLQRGDGVRSAEVESDLDAPLPPAEGFEVQHVEPEFLPGFPVFQTARQGRAADVCALVAGAETDRVRAGLASAPAPADAVVVRIEPQRAQAQPGVRTVLVDVVGTPVRGLLRTEPRPHHPVRPMMRVLVVRRVDLRHRERDRKQVGAAGETQLPRCLARRPARLAARWRPSARRLGADRTASGRVGMLSIPEVAHRLGDPIHHALAQGLGHPGCLPGRLLQPTRRSRRRAPAAGRRRAGARVDGRRHHANPLTALQQVHDALAFIGLDQAQEV